MARGGHRERVNDPLNPRLAHSPVGSSSVCYAHGHEIPDWTRPDLRSAARIAGRPGGAQPGAAPRLPGDALPAGRFRRTARYPLLIVHDGGDYLTYAAAKTVLDNLIHRLDVAEIVAAFTYPGDRLAEYANSAAHARFLTAELLPRLEAELPLVGTPSGRCLMGSQFRCRGRAVDRLSPSGGLRVAAACSPARSSSPISVIDHGGGPPFDPVVRFVNRYRSAPRRVADRVFVSCGVYEPLIVPNRSMVPVFEAAGMAVRYVEARDGHNWENWRDRLREGLSWIFPGPQKFFYE